MYGIFEFSDFTRIWNAYFPSMAIPRIRADLGYEIEKMAMDWR